LNGRELFHVGTAEAASRVGFVDDSHISWGGEDHYFSNAEWHNVTYTYNGEGSDKKLYLDGRLVGSAANEDTFGDYPPFAMSTYSEYGYTVSTSLDIPAGQAWEAFDNIEDNYNYAWQGDGTTYSTSTRLHTGGETTTVSGTGYLGDWIQMEFPHKMYLSYVGILPMVTYGVERMPGIAIFAGSNDATTWTLIRSITKNDHTAGNYSNYILNSNICYKYIRIIWNELTTAGSTDGYRTRAAAQEIKLFGHRENDLVRFPDPTNVLKYPHVAMTGPAQRGYVATANQNFNNRDAYDAFNELPVGILDNGWSTLSNAFDSTGAAVDGVGSRGTYGSYTGHWIKLQLPRKIKVNNIYVGSRDMTTSDTREPVEGAFFGSNDDSSWDLLHEFSASTNPLSFTTLPGSSVWTYADINTLSASNTNYYKYIVLVVTKIAASTQFNVLQIQDLKYYGTEEDSDVVTRIGDGYDGKVRNLRVFSTALSQDRVQEIFDADKDEFALAKSSVSVYRGHLGIGTTEPKAALTVMDEVGELEEFPPRAMTDYETYMDGHGVFKVSASEEYAKTIAGGTSGDEAWANFDKASTNWTGGDSYTGTSNTYAGTHTSGGYGGDYIELKLPYKIRLQQFTIQPHPNLLNRWSKSGVVVAKNANDNAWTNIFTWSGSSVASVDKYNPVYFRGVDSSNAYDTFRLVITSVDSQPFVTLRQWRLFGTREQGASTLHNGELTLTRNLTVPRIGPALDADDTPRRDRLVVEYNTSTNPTENGVVKDTSGHPNGRLGGGAYYDSLEKCFVNDNGGTAYSAYIDMADWIHNRGFIHSFSGWFKFTGIDSWEGLYSVGNSTSAFGTQFTIWAKPNANYFRTEADGGGGWIDHTYSFTANEWTHIAVVKSTSAIDSTRIYVDGTIIPQSPGTNSSNVVALSSGPQIFRLGAAASNGVLPLTGRLANIKIWENIALTADEVKRLYDMGRCDEGHHVVNFSKTRVGIGLGDGEVPQSTLDVRGTFQGNSSLRFFVLNGKFPATGTTQDVTDLPAELIERADRIVFMQGMTVETNGDRVNWIRHGSSTWEVDIKYDAAVPKFLLSGFDASVTITSKEWRMFIVTT
jgi:hypothetical protein